METTIEKHGILASLRSDKHVHPQEKLYYFLTMQECKNLSGHCLVLDRYGKIAQVKITSVKSWKTRSDVLVSWKFGLYEYGKELVTGDISQRFFVKEGSNE